MEVLGDPNRIFVTSDFIRLEVLPKANYQCNYEEAEFYETFFQGAYRTVPSSKRLFLRANEEACRLGLAAMDALHVAAAKIGRATELITTEKATKPIFRATGIAVVTIQP